MLIRIDQRLARLTFTILLFALVLAATPADGPHVRQQDNPALSTFSTIDGLLKAFYQSLCFPEGKEPDWECFRSLFGYVTSPCVRIAADSVMTMDREGFITFFTGRIKQGTLRSFDEKEVARTGEYYGSIAQVFSAYEKRMNLATGSKPIRGINSFQLFFWNNRWWIASVVWQDESAEKPIPEKYLIRK